MSLAHAFHNPESQYIFNHDIMSCTDEGVVGNHLYSGRALGLTEVDDIIQIHPSLKTEWFAISAHYQRIGLSHTSDVLWDVSPKVLEDHSELRQSLYFFGPREHRVRPDYKFHKVVEHINSKNNFIALASHLRLDIPHTQSFNGKQWFAGIKDFPYPCYLKASVSVAGNGIFRCENPSDLIKALAYFEEDVPLQVQEEINTQIFLNLQFKSSRVGLERLMVTEQVLDGFTHQGNRFPASDEPWDSVQPMAEWLVEKGIRDVFAFDVAVVKNERDTRFVPIECNPRFNGASYPSGVACKLNIPQWVAKEFKTKHHHVSQLDLSGIEYDPATQTGIILINWGTIQVGKVAVLISGNAEQQRQTETLLIQRL